MTMSAEHRSKFAALRRHLDDFSIFELDEKPKTKKKQTNKCTVYILKSALNYLDNSKDDSSFFQMKGNAHFQGAIIKK